MTWVYSTDKQLEHAFLDLYQQGCTLMIPMLCDALGETTRLGSYKEDTTVALTSHRMCLQAPVSGTSGG